MGMERNIGRRKLRRMEDRRDEVVKENRKDGKGKGREGV
jgi:hypothetical protein